MKKFKILFPCLVVILAACNESNQAKSTHNPQISDTVEVEKTLILDDMVSAKNDTIIYDVADFKTITRIDSIGEKYEAHVILYESDTDSLSCTETRDFGYPDNKVVIYFKSLKENKVDTINLNKQMFLNWLIENDTIFQKTPWFERDNLTIYNIRGGTNGEFTVSYELLDGDFITIYFAIDEPDTCNVSTFLYRKKWGEEGVIVLLKRNAIWGDEYEAEYEAEIIIEKEIEEKYEDANTGNNLTENTVEDINNNEVEDE